MKFIFLYLVGAIAQAESSLGLNTGDLVAYPIGTGIFERIFHFTTPPDVRASQGLTVPVELIWSRPVSERFDFVLHGFYRYSSLIVVKTSHQIALMPGTRYWFQGRRQGWVIQEGVGLGYWNLTPSAFGNNTLGIQYNFNQMALAVKLAVSHVWLLSDKWNFELGLGGIGFFKLLGSEFAVSGIAASTHYLFRLTPSLIAVFTYHFGEVQKTE